MLRTTAAAAFGFTMVPRHVLGGPGHVPPSEQLTKGIIGVGGMGTGHFGLGNSRTLAVCDVDAERLAAAVEKGGADCTGYHDFRELLERDDIDVVHIATPPHWHGLMAIAAVNAGKDVWCEKPLTRTIGEGEALVDAVRRTGRMLRINTWFRMYGSLYKSGYTARDLRRVADHRLLGWPLKVNLGPATGFDWKQYWCGKTDLTPQEVPAHFDYDLWLGPAPYKPYHVHRTHSTFRGYWDYDGGGLGDMSMHYVDPFQSVLDKDHESPEEIVPEGDQQHYDAVRPWLKVRLAYRDGCEIVFDNVSKGRVPLLEGPLGRLYPEWETDVPGLNRRYVNGLPDLRPTGISDFGQSIRTRQRFALNEVNGHRSATLVNLAKIGIRLGRPLRFDDGTQRFVGDEQANRLIHQPMRAPWVLDRGPA
jgi:hypothetical protein